VWLDGDVLRLAQVFSRLIEDAAREAAGSGRIVLAASATSQRVQVTVHGDGPARPPEALERPSAATTSVSVRRHHLDRREHPSHDARRALAGPA
jgi:signal transduction histidine kinase